MKILCDVDGVLADFSTRAEEIIKTLFPSKNIPEHYNWNFGLEDEELKKVFDVILDTKNFWLSLPPYHENLFALENFVLNNSEQELFFITSRKETPGLSVSEQTWKWLNKFIYLKNKRGNVFHILPVSKPEKKIILIEALGITHSVDDHAPSVKAFSEIPGHTCYVLRRPWNLDEDCGNAIPINNLYEFFEELTLQNVN
jgi:hypothetical protein